MSLRNVPSEEEVMGWNPQTLADYMKKLKLSSCDELVLKKRITGTQFMKMKQREFEAFPGLCAQKLASIQREIKTGMQRLTIGSKSKTHKHLEAVSAKREEECDDSDYENVYETTSDDDKDEGYICALADQLTAEKQQSGKACKGKPMTQSYAFPMGPPKPERSGISRDCRRDPAERNFTHSHPKPTKTDRTPTPSNTQLLYSDLKKEKKKIPELPGASTMSTTKSKGSIVLPPTSNSMRLPKPSTPKPADIPKSSVPLTATKSTQERKSIPEPRQMKTQSSDMPMGRRHNPDVDVDSGWYVGKMSRSLAEMALREVNKDGAFLVRDSSTGSTEHSFTLMILNKGKVYNIKIRNQGSSYVLGNGLRNYQSFPGVREMINHHTYNPLLLIDGRDQRSEEQPQCRLQHPVGL